MNAEWAIMQIASAESLSTRGESHQPALIGLAISHTCLPCLPSRWVSPGCSVTPYDWTVGGFVGVFLRMVWF